MKKHITFKTNVVLINYGINSNLFRMVLISSFFMLSWALQAQQVLELDAWLQARKSQKSVKVKNEADKVTSLARDLNTMVYFENGAVRTYGEGKPVFLEATFDDVSQLYRTSTLYDSVEMIKIKLRSPALQKNTLNAASLSHFKSLKYILIECNFNCNPEDLVKRVIPAQGIQIFYSIVIPQ